jgi:phosphomannomutase/phosphoglucomutase
MITASHNPNGWTGIKMSAEPKLTHGMQEMRELREIVMNADVESIGGGRYRFEPDWAEQYIASHAKPVPQAGQLKVVLACGNGTASVFAPAALRGMGVDVIERHCTLDHSFPHFNPNPEDEAFMADLAESVAEHAADLGIALDGDGDRIGFVTASGKFPSNDKTGLVLARYLAQQQPGAKFVVDVKSTGLFAVDDVLQAKQAETVYWKTGHSYIKRKVKELNALAGFEKSGHFFLNHPVGPLYDDAIAGARLMIQTLLTTDKTLDELLAELPTTYQSPSLYPSCPDAEKYQIINGITEHFQELADIGKTVAGQAITELVTVNGVRVMLADGSWCLVRASSNIPALGVVVESPTSAAQRDAILSEVEALLAATGKVGPLTAKH